MTGSSDLLMPKLGLTMTEGTIAHWVVQPGARFSAGDVIVVVETDKIANEVEAPAAGELEALLSPEGTVVPVGAPIARWRLEDAGHTPPSVPEASKPRPVEARAAAEKPAPSPTAIPLRVGDRVIATPYARRLARDAALDLTGIAGSGPRGRIKAADIVRALEMHAPLVDAQPMQTPMKVATRDAAALTSASFASIDVDVTALKAIDARLAGTRARSFDGTPYVVLACLKALDAEGDAQIRLGLAKDNAIAWFDGSARDTLSRVVARLENLGVADGGGDLAVFISDGKLRVFAPAVPAGWHMALGVGGVRPARAGDATHEMTLALTYDASAIGHSAAAQVLERIAALLDEPLHLLAT
jgi:pyruvate dehydrogenase E2 component (dihydrolipoamide acetyltransferase)